MPKYKGMLVDVYRNANHGGYDCTNGGVTSWATEVLLVGEGVPEVDEVEYPVVDRPAPSHPDLDLSKLPPIETLRPTPVLRLVKRNFHDGPYYHAEPVDRGDRWCMSGGNFIWCCDSRIRAICQYPIPVHDRFEQEG